MPLLAVHTNLSVRVFRKLLGNSQAQTRTSYTRVTEASTCEKD